MKKRSMLAIASLATGFVVAAISPSHSVDQRPDGIGAGQALGSLDGAVAAADTPQPDDAPAPGAREN
ncbi:hypothetical protein [Streptomyces sp. NPDC006610]|jgi:hypothetical protein|uniref:hypothetical protein n=1 Tax=Streptomyces sp. NPDC006610 TaxID=3154584 RepID=UPI0033B704E7